MKRIKPFDRIQNLPRPVPSKDFRLSALALLVLALFLAAGLLWQLHSGFPGPTVELLYVTGEAAVGVILLMLLPSWGLVLLLVVGFSIGLFARYGGSALPLALLIALGYLLAPVFQIAHQWEKAVILRLGRFSRLRGPGVFLIFPFIDRVIRFVDTRIRATDFSAEKTITMDTVPVHVDALAFWMIWDATKAILEVENFLEAVVLSAQTALRDAIGRHDLSALLAERERLGKEIQQVLDRKTNPWGITILSIEFTDIIIPKELEDAMSKRAQAERERQSRVILSGAEVEVSDKFVEAARRYREDPTALHLRGMNMIYEGIKQRGTIVLLPSGGLASMALGAGTLEGSSAAAILGALGGAPAGGEGKKPGPEGEGAGQGEQGVNQ